MKRVVVDTGLHESDIRPQTIMSEFRRLSLIDASNYFGSEAQLVEVDCPACGSDEKQGVFRKDLFLYCECTECRSVFVSPRPTAKDIEDYRANAAASHYRAEHLARDTSKARRFHLLSVHASWLGQIVDDRGSREARSYMDLGTSLPEIFDEIRQLDLFDELYCRDPMPTLEEACRERGVEVNPEAVEKLGALTAFEQLEHQHSPYDFLCGIRDDLEEGGLLFMTTRTISGFDLLVLWDKAPYIFVPEHLNLLSIEGIHTLLKRCGLEVVEMSTPGQLDLEFVARASEADPSIELPRFVRHLLWHCDRLGQNDFQAFLQKHRLSSHLRVAAQKPRKMK